MAEREIKDKNGLIIGWCKDFGDRVNATHFSKGYVGCYNKGTNTTFDDRGNIFSSGDATVALIFNAEANK